MKDFGESFSNPARRAQPAPAPIQGIDAAAKKLAECMDYPWEHMPEAGRTKMREHAQAVIQAAAPVPQVVPAEIAAIAERLHTQDNRITDNPLFAVQQKLRVYGVDTDYRDGFEYANEVGETCEEGDKSAREVGYVDRWEFVTGCLTEQGCKDYIACNGHNLHEPRIYAYGSYRNAEFIALRKWLMSLDRAALQGVGKP